MRQAAEVRRPIRRSLLLGGAAFAVALVLSVSAVVNYVFTATLYERYQTKLSNIIDHVETNVDADDLARCIRTGVPSREYAELQGFLNGMVDDFEIEYLYLVIPSSDVMVNAISATSEEERAAGETDMGLLETTDAYSADSLERYRSYWDAEQTCFFEETSGYGTYYTGVKPLRDSSGDTVALICADLPILSLRQGLVRVFLGFLAAFAVLFAAFGAVASWWTSKNITAPLLALERAAREFAARSHETSDARAMAFEPPDIHTDNEIETLAMSITKMASDIRAHVGETLAAQERANAVERENVRMAQEAKSAKKIAELSESVGALFANIPGPAFSKDANTGVYLACNQAFAEYAHKGSPDGVVGLTDFQIFDEATARHFVDDDAKTLSMDEPYVFFEDVLDAAGNPKQFQTTKMKFFDTKGRLCTLGMCVDVTDLVAARRETMAAMRAYEVIRDESITYYGIARALSGDFLSLYYVDLDTEHYTLYQQDSDHEALTVQEEGEGFFASVQVEARRQVYAADQESFMQTLTKDNVLRSLDEMGHFTLTYRLILDGVPTYMGLKATRAAEGDSHLVIGVGNIDAQMKQREAARRLEEERSTIARITALSGDYLVIYAVDPDTNGYVTYQLSNEYHDRVMLTEGDDFFADVFRMCHSFVHEDDIGLVRTLLIKDRVLSEVRAQGVFTMTFRMLHGGGPTYVTLRAALVEEADGPQLIMGLSDVDAQVRRDQEFAVARRRANRDALTGVQNKHAYLDAEAVLDERSAAGEEVEYAVVVCDLNDLKAANDTCGHREGDRLLREASAILGDVFANSAVYRVGGDEFVLILEGEDYRRRDELLLRLSQSNDRNVRTGHAVIAWGMACHQPGERVSTAFDRADAAMYRNKRRLKEGAEPPSGA